MDLFDMFEPAPELWKREFSLLSRHAGGQCSPETSETGLFQQYLSLPIRKSKR
jgi:hypothetical protein